jgi:hypothetical protein
MYENVEAVVLSAEKVGEYDRRLSLFTRERGRVWASAAGIGRPRARLAAAAQPAVHARFRLWVPPRGPARVTGGGLLSAFPRLRADWRRSSSALFLCEWTEALTALDQPRPETFDLLRDALAALESSDETARVRAAYLRRFIRWAGDGPRPTPPGDAEEAARRLDAWDFGAPLPEIPMGAVAFLEDQAVKSMAPLLTRPLRSLAHGRSLHGFLAKRGGGR